MSEEDDMERPVTRRELKIELEKFGEKLEEKLEKKFDDKLGMLGAMLMAEISKLAEAMAAMEQRMIGEMARQTRAAMEWARAEFRVVDDQYSDLPARVSRLERKVFPPKRARGR